MHTQYRRNVRTAQQDEQVSIFALANAYPLLSAEREQELLSKKGTGEWEEARNILTMSNLRLVFSIARSYGWLENCNMEDIVMSGIVGLMSAIDRYDGKGGKLSTYATPWIKKNIKHDLGYHNSMIHIPAYIQNNRKVVFETQKRLIQSGIPQPTSQMIADETGIPVSQVKNIMKSAATLVISLNTLIGEQEEDGELGDFIPDDRIWEDSVIDRLMAEEMTASIRRMDKGKQDALFYRYGFSDGKPKSLQECSELTGVSKECVRLRQKKAEAILKAEYVPAGCI